MGQAYDPALSQHICFARLAFFFLPLPTTQKIAQSAAPPILHATSPGPTLSVHLFQAAPLQPDLHWGPSLSWVKIFDISAGIKAQCSTK